MKPDKGVVVIAREQQPILTVEQADTTFCVTGNMNHFDFSVSKIKHIAIPKGYQSRCVEAVGREILLNQEVEAGPTLTHGFGHICPHLLGSEEPDHF